MTNDNYVTTNLRRLADDELVAISRALDALQTSPEGHLLLERVVGERISRQRTQAEREGWQIATTAPDWGANR